jgi:hypothetical protein
MIEIYASSRTILHNLYNLYLYLVHGMYEERLIRRLPKCKLLFNHSLAVSTP